VVSIANLTSGQIVPVVPREPPHYAISPDWLPDNRLAVPDPQTQSVLVFRADGQKSTADLPFAPGLSISSAGLVLAIDPSSPVLVAQTPDGRRVDLDLGRAWGLMPNNVSWVAWSSDGKEAVLVCTAQSSVDGVNYDETAILIGAS
jgi:hypothetical protein